MKLEKIIDFMEELAPKEGAMEYDNVGLLVGRGEKEVTRVLTSLDCTLDVVREAKEKGCEAVVCHHPIMFGGVKKITDETKEGEMLLCAIEQGIAIYACHTNLDFAEGGLNDYFLEKIGYTACGTILENEGRIFETGAVTVADLCAKIKKAFDVPHLRVAGDTLRESAMGALCTGSGKSLVHEAVQKADVYITGDMGHHDILSVVENGCAYIEISHYDSEKIAMELLKCKLSEKFPQLEVFMSQENKNPLTFV
ncbi:MAG: Nif3-like dinuclear metal center hexameric protein [Clostridia bacterium]|nr:Nif3-like dinuclear metal center hexameric protein [Clostridia bacterium]